MRPTFNLYEINPRSIKKSYHDPYQEPFNIKKNYLIKLFSLEKVHDQIINFLSLLVEFFWEFNIQHSDVDNLISREVMRICSYFCKYFLNLKMQKWFPKKFDWKKKDEHLQLTSLTFFLILSSLVSSLIELAELWRCKNEENGNLGFVLKWSSLFKKDNIY